jgi:hypothetical protein
MPLEELTVGEDLIYQEYPMTILDSEKVTRNNRYKMCNGVTIPKKKLHGKKMIS